MPSILGKRPTTSWPGMIFRSKYDYWKMQTSLNSGRKQCVRISDGHQSWISDNPSKWDIATALLGEPGEAISSTVVDNNAADSANVGDRILFYEEGTYYDWVIAEVTEENGRIVAAVINRVPNSTRIGSITPSSKDEYELWYGEYYLYPGPGYFPWDNENASITLTTKTTESTVSSKTSSGCPRCTGVGDLNSIYTKDNSCPKCGYPGLIPKSGWCQHKKLRVGYNGFISCLGDDCDATFKIPKAFQGIIRPNTVLYRAKMLIHPVLEKEDKNNFFCEVDLKANAPDEFKSKVFAILPENDLAKAPIEGWNWTKPSTRY